MNTHILRHTYTCLYVGNHSIDSHPHLLSSGRSHHHSLGACTLALSVLKHTHSHKLLAAIVMKYCRYIHILSIIYIYVSYVEFVGPYMTHRTSMFLFSLRFPCSGCCLQFACFSASKKFDERFYMVCSICICVSFREISNIKRS